MVCRAMATTLLFLPGAASPICACCSSSRPPCPHHDPCSNPRKEQHRPGAIISCRLTASARLLGTSWLMYSSGWWPAGTSTLRK